MNDELLTGRNPQADAELAAAIGCKLTDEVPPVILGNPGYETDAAGEPIDLPGLTDERRKIAFQHGFCRAKLAITKMLLPAVWEKDKLSKYDAILQVVNAIEAIDLDAEWENVNS